MTYRRPPHTPFEAAQAAIAEALRASQTNRRD